MAGFLAGLFSPNGFNFPLCGLHVSGLAKLACRSNALFLTDCDACTVVFKVAVNLYGVTEKMKVGVQ